MRTKLNDLCKDQKRNHLFLQDSVSERRHKRATIKFKHLVCCSEALGLLLEIQKEFNNVLTDPLYVHTHQQAAYSLTPINQVTAKRFLDDLLFSVPSLLTLSLELISPESSGGLCPAAASTNLRDMTGRTSPELTDQSVCVCKGSVFPYPPAKTAQISAISLLLRKKDTKPS